MAGSLVTRGRALLQREDPTTALVDRVRALREAADACEGRVPGEVVDEAYRVGLQVDRRLALSGGATVVALAGATGSGKSSTFNALTGADVATVGVRRPTTSVTMAAISMRASVRRSRPVISQSTHTSRSLTVTDPNVSRRAAIPGNTGR